MLTVYLILTKSLYESTSRGSLFFLQHTLAAYLRYWRCVIINTVDTTKTRIAEKHHKNGNIECREYSFNDKLHRLDGPAREHFYSKGEIHLREWYQNNIRHRIDGPAYEAFYENGKLKIRQ